jgi:exosortase family protein XrtM
LIEDITVKTAVGFVNFISPTFASYAQGTHMTSSAGGINVVSGCEGVEVMFLLIAAIIISPLRLRAKIACMLIGLFYVFFLNQIRLVVMFYAVREHKQLFELVHGIIAPIILVAFTGLFLAFWIARFGQPISLNVKVPHVLAD